MNAPQNQNQQEKKAVPLESMLLSPPQARQADMFSPASMSMSRSNSQSTIVPSAIPKVSQGQGQSLPLSPPISPQRQKEDVIGADEGLRDPPLFPREASDLSAASVPLFPTNQSRRETIERHIAAGGVCKEEDYDLILEACSQTKFSSQVGVAFKKDPVAWYRQSLRDITHYVNLDAKRKNAPTLKAKPKTPMLRRLAPALEGGVRKPIRLARTPKTPKPKPSPPQDLFGMYTWAAKEQTPKAPKQVTSRDDIDYNSLQDFCPPTSNLGNNAKALKADWKGQVLDLSDDPDRHMLHEAEVNLAATLRLSCAVYLSSKRRIFIARVQCGMRGKEFRKTDAQQACKIDVNKASKLWTAFEKVGWFDNRHFAGKVI